MARLVFTLTGLLATVACTRENPTNCLDNFCNDPALPYCDADGSIEGVPGTCIAVACEPLAFETCSGDSAVTCDATGTSYDTTPCEFGCGLVGCRQCEPNQTACADGASITCDAQGFVAESMNCLLGCDGTTGECRRCEPNQTTCTNGNVVTCDAAGNVTNSVECPLGCFEDEPRCRAIDPSNGLATILDMVADPPDVTLADGFFVATDSGGIGPPGGPDLQVPNYLIVTPGPTPDIRVFVVNSLTVNGNVRVYGDYERGETPSPSIAFVAKHDIVIRGALRVEPTAGQATGSICSAGPVYSTQRSNGYLYVASGGGGNATAGGAGGGVSTVDFEDAPGGAIIGSAELVPLQGGCGAGGYRLATGITQTPGTGGGAIQFSSATRIEVDGVVDVRGFRGWPEQGGALPTGSFVFGGGAGGSILFEAPTVTLAAGARLIAKGGSGGALGSMAQVSSDDAAPAAGGTCFQPGPRCGSGGNGAAPGTEATKGVTAVYESNAAGLLFVGGGGGGGLGRVRINTRDGSYSKTNEVIEAAVVSAGVINTR